jgi:hypothetical protein
MGGSLQRNGSAQTGGYHSSERCWFAQGQHVVALACEGTIVQRFTAVLDPAGNSITARWESSRDGQTWHHDFNETYTRVV